MARQRPFDPLSCLPSSGIVEQQLAEAEARAEKLRTLLRITREVEIAGQATSSAGLTAERARQPVSTEGRRDE